jgi:hypothetical protein
MLSRDRPAAERHRVPHGAQLRWFEFSRESGQRFPARFPDLAPSHWQCRGTGCTRFERSAHFPRQYWQESRQRIVSSAMQGLQPWVATDHRPSRSAQPHWINSAQLLPFPFPFPFPPLQLPLPSSLPFKSPCREFVEERLSRDSIRRTPHRPACLRVDSAT